MEQKISQFVEEGYVESSDEQHVEYEQAPINTIKKQNKQVLILQSNTTQVLLTNRLNLLISILLLLIITAIIIHKILYLSQIKIDTTSQHTVNNIPPPVHNIKQQQQSRQQKKLQNIGDNVVSSMEDRQIEQKSVSSEREYVPEKQQLVVTATSYRSSGSDSVSSVNSGNSGNINDKYNLIDFTIQKPYIEAPSDIREIFDRMIKRNPTKNNKLSSIFHPSQKAYFAYNLHTQPTNPDYLRAQYFYYNNKYNISQYSDSQLPICIVAPGRNIAKSNQFIKFLQSIARQNYTNYKLVYIDDVSDDGSVSLIRNMLRIQQGQQGEGENNDVGGSKDKINQQQKQKQEQVQNEGNKGVISKLQGKVIIVENKQRQYALANRNIGIRNYCHEDDIVLDVDSDDQLIGAQVLQFINAIYHNDDLWQSNSVFVYYQKVKKQVTTGPIDGIPLQLLKNNKYRGSMIWKTSELRTFRAKLFNKIDQADFKDSNGNYYKWASDHFMQEPLIELSGYLHYKHYFEIMYWYNWDFDKTTVYKRRHYRDIAWTQRPYQNLASLDDKAQKVSSWQISQKMKIEYDKNVKQAQGQAKKYGRTLQF